MSDVDEMIRRANARRKKRWPFFAVLLGIFSLPFSYIGYARWAKHRAEHRFDLDAGGRSELAKKLDVAEKEVAKREAVYRAAVPREKLAALEPSDTPCPSAAMLPSEVTRADDPAPLGSTLSGLTSRLAELRKKLGEGRATTEDLRVAEAIGGSAWDGGTETLLFADEIVEARMTRDPDTKRIGFISGRVTGRTYLYSFEAGRIICAGRFEARSSPTLEVKYQSTSISPTLEDPATSLARTEAEKTKLREDLFTQAQGAARDGLRALRQSAD